MKFKCIKNEFYKFSLENHNEFVYDGKIVYIKNVKFTASNVVYQGKLGNRGICCLLKIW
jgi:hypothetical protein